MWIVFLVAPWIARIILKRISIISLFYKKLHRKQSLKITSSIINRITSSKWLEKKWKVNYKVFCKRSSPKSSIFFIICIHVSITGKRSSISKRKTLITVWEWCFQNWLGMRDSNPRMVESKSTALPLGESPEDSYAFLLRENRRALYESIPKVKIFPSAWEERKRLYFLVIFIYSYYFSYTLCLIL